MYACIHLPSYLSTVPLNHPFIYLSIHPFTHPYPICPPIHPLSHLYLLPFIHPSIPLSISHILTSTTSILPPITPPSGHLRYVQNLSCLPCTRHWGGHCWSESDTTLSSRTLNTLGKQLWLQKIMEEEGNVNTSAWVFLEEREAYDGVHKERRRGKDRFIRSLLSRLSETLLSSYRELWALITPPPSPGTTK